MSRFAHPPKTPVLSCVANVVGSRGMGEDPPSVLGIKKAAITLRSAKAEEITSYFQDLLVINQAAWGMKL